MRAVREDVAHVGAAPTACDLVADHAVAGIALGINDFLFGRGIETGPAAAGIKLCLRRKQFRSAADTEVHARFVMVPILTGESRLGSFFAGYEELIGCELVSPRIFAFLDFGRHG